MTQGLALFVAQNNQSVYEVGLKLIYEGAVFPDVEQTATRT